MATGSGSGRVGATGTVVRIGTPAPPVTKYVNKVGSDGWLQARATNGSLVPMCKYTQVTILEAGAERTRFKVADGRLAGTELSLSTRNAGEYLGLAAPKAGAVKAVVTYGAFVKDWVSKARGGEKLDQQMATLELGTLKVDVTLNSVWGREFSPLPKGNYRVLLPDAPHSGDMTRFYRRVEPTLQFDQVWFPVKYKDNSRYVHVGNLSDGCVTVLDLAQWAAVHETLVSHRDPDGMTVALLEVKGSGP